MADRKWIQTNERFHLCDEELFDKVFGEFCFSGAAGEKILMENPNPFDGHGKKGGYFIDIV